MLRTRLLCALALPCLLGCAPTHAATALGYSHWYQRSGAGSMGEFKEQQRRCLEQVGAAADPAAVEPGSDTEARFIGCMNGANWCTVRHQCSEPGM